MTGPTIFPEALRPQVEGDFANERVKQAIMASLFDEPAAPAKIGRFTVLRELGRGGTGVVYAAYDEELERKVAVKLLHSEAGAASTPEARTRLLREAQAMARLSHPNIVSVHEVGTHLDQVYVAMEFVHGVTLSTWLKRQQRTWREIVDVFRQAASGLAAAHEAGLVHRDFKPQNAMVGDDGRVRVLDFGLARAEGDPQLFADLERTRDPELSFGSGSGSAGMRPLDASLTITGSLVGTPAYMAPEQFRGDRADARSDQFALCVALYEALFRSRPFPGDSLAELMRAVLAGQLREPGGARVPRALRAAVMRGLQVRPEHRHPSMDALIAAIDRVVEPPRTAWLAAAGFTAVFAAVGVGLSYQTGVNIQVCEDRARQEIAEVWNPARFAGVGASLRAVDPTVAQSWTVARRQYDEYAERWTEVAADACVAAEVRHEQSSALYELRRACLGDRLRDFKAVLDLFGRPDAAFAVHASDLVAGLESPQSCADPLELQRRAAPPDDPELARTLAEQHAAIARAESHRRAGKFPEALAVLDALALPDGQLPLRADYELTRGRVLVSSGRPKDALLSLQTAYFAALESGHERVAIAAATELVEVTGVHLADFIAAERWVRHVDALLARGGAPPQRAALAQAQGEVALATGRYAEALGHFERAIAMHEAAGSSHLPEVSVLFRLASDAATSLGLLDTAEQHVDRALVTLRQRLCDPGVTPATTVDYKTLVAAGDAAPAEVGCCQRHPEYAASLRSAGMLALRHGQADAAAAIFERARLGIAGLVPDDSHLALQLTNGAVEALMLRGDPAQAARQIRRALVGATSATVGLPIDARPLHPELFRLRVWLAQALLRQGDLAGAEAEIRATVVDAERAWGEDEPYIASALEVLAEVLATAGRTTEAVTVAERAYAVASARGELVQPSLRYASAFRLARSLAFAGQSERAEHVAEEARALAAAASDVRMVAAVDAWLLERKNG
ncbi:Serine/threonine protein kinase [Nannocystis exedens]|uniref:Serine/threonine protein kinase n=1 Tax=Nannocystis exedens TaxID=54 RepID=A0A1I1YSS5_9BACT|nr:serine/threonine-protein kinase [Nannocystis exedens]PCC70258.1 protein kinase [Nannocystis exedens]SFE21030.1 Serine/threonine protein kinase [Nannocystis exedens]